MGLDMYLHKYPRIDGYSLSSVMEIGDTVAEEVKAAGGIESYSADKNDKDRDIKEQIAKYVHPYEFLSGEFYFGDEIMYWRKANAIHNYLVEFAQNGEDDCLPHEVSKDVIVNLLDKCSQTISILENAPVKTVKPSGSSSPSDDYVKYDVDESTLPLAPTDGFFFGSTAIDENYLSDIKDTADTCGKILDELDFDNNYLVYRASW